MVSLHNGDIRFDCSDKEDPKKLKLVYEFAPITHPKYGCAEKIRGEIRLLQRSNFQISNYFQLNISERENLVNASLKRLRHVYEDLDEEGAKKKIQYFTYLSACLFPHLDVNSARFEISLNIVVATYQFDDIFEANESFDDIGFLTRMIVTKQINWKQLAEDTTERTTLFEDVSAQFPGMEVQFRTFHETLTKLKTEFPKGLPPGVKYYLARCVMATQGFLLGYNGEGPLTLTEETLAVVREDDACSDAAVEMVTFLMEFTVSKKIRRSLLFELMMRCVRVYGAVINDIMGLNRDIAAESLNGSVILRRVVREGLTLGESCAVSSKRLSDIIHDMQVITTRLSQAFPTEEGLAGFIQAVKEFCDGQVFAYYISALCGGRYGTLHMEIVLDET